MRRPPRIIAGEFKGRPLEFPRGAELRPTADRVREALFSSLAPYLPGARFADLFAGTGAVGLEALSRGADFALFVESNPRCVQALRANVAKLEVEAWVVVAPGRAERIWPRLAAEHGPFDVIFLDPPYADRGGEDVLALLLGDGLGLAAEGAGLRPQIIFQHGRRTPPASPVEPWRAQDFGETRLSWYRLPSPGGAE
jgi:16S rRNA (guanine(966)-N(2))-methyltransferase RsmD